MKRYMGWVAVLVLACATAAFAGKQDFTLVNNTGADISEIYISSAAVDNWEEDLLGGDKYLPDGNEVDIHFASDEDAELWDIRVVDSDGTAVVFQRIKLTAVTKVTLTMEDGEPTAELESASGEDDSGSDAEATSNLDFTLVNATGVDIAQLFVSAADVDNWEEDLLGKDDTLADGSELNVHFSPAEEAELWDIRIVDSEGTAIDWKGLKLSEISKVTLQIEDGEPTATLE